LPNAAEEAVVTIDPDSGDIRVYGQELDEDGNVVREWDDTPKDFGRIAAQTAKQVMTQRIREAERDLKYEEYAGREGDIVTGIIQQSDNRYTLLDLGKVEALLPQAEQVPYERYEHGARLKAYIVEVRKTTKGPQIVVSRTHPGLIKRLFELEVPEISSGVVEIKAAAREPGHRTKIAVWSNDPNVDPVGACVGARGARVRMVTNELRGEKVDIVPFSDEPREFVMRALQPAKVKEVHLDDLTGTATVVVHDFQLSLAIGKEGQNARLAARLTGWRIDIKSETQIAEEEAYNNQEWAEGEWVENEAGEMVWQPAEGGEAVSAEQWSLGENPDEAVPSGGNGSPSGESGGQGQQGDGVVADGPDASGQQPALQEGERRMAGRPPGGGEGAS
jgi:N utilization substance protein A